MFSERKTAQIAAYFLHRAGGTMEHVKLMKLMYLADREALDAYGSSISKDTMYSMKMGPVLSHTLDLMGGNYDPLCEGEWSGWISPKEHYCVSIKKEITDKSFDEMSEAEMSILEKIFKEFGDWEMRKLIDYTHGFREWKNPGIGRLPIEYRDIFEALGKPEDKIAVLLEYLQDEAEISAALASI